MNFLSSLKLADFKPRHPERSEGSILMKRFLSHFDEVINPPHPSYRHLLPRMGRRKNCAFTLAEGATHVDIPNCQRKIAFTLAEVLVTLGIIGVIAALTIPTLIANHRTKEMQARFNKTYSELSQINDQFKAEYDLNMCTYTWDYVKFKGNGTWGIGDLPKQIGLHMKTEFVTIPKYNIRTLNNNSADTTLMDDGGRNQDEIGRVYYFEYANESVNKCPIITVDLNGKAKPNKFGLDIFAFRPTKTGRLTPMGNGIYEGDDDVNWGEIDSMAKPQLYCSKTSSNGYNGLGCSYYASVNEHPSENGKTYWKDFIVNY